MTGYSDETREIAFQHWHADVPLPQIRDELGVSLRTLETWRSVDGWVARARAERGQRVKRERQAAEDHLADNQTKIMQEMITIALADPENSSQLRAKVTMLKHLSGILGWSERHTADRIHALIADVDELDDEPQLSGAEAIAQLEEILPYPPIPFTRGDGRTFVM